MPEVSNQIQECFSFLEKWKKVVVFLEDTIIIGKIENIKGLYFANYSPDEDVSTREFLRRLGVLGIRFFIFEEHPIGPTNHDFYGGLEELIECDFDRDRLLAHMHGVLLEKYLVWKEYVDNPTCRGVTTKGRKCNQLFLRIPRSPKDIIAPIDYYCHHHQDQVPVQRQIKESVSGNE